MIREELLRKIRRLEIVSKRRAQSLFAGRYHSAFRGRGMEFAEVREYQPGDDVRTIDWNVTSRTGRLFVKQYVEERELTVILAVDRSASLGFYSTGRSKGELAGEIAAVVAAAALINQDKVGLLLFSDRIERFIPPKRGRAHLPLLLREILHFRPSGTGTAMGPALVYLQRAIKKRAVIFLISDFLDLDIEAPLKTAGRKHDVIVVDIGDPRERELPPGGTFLFRDSENGRERIVDLGAPGIRRGFLEAARRREQRLEELLAAAGLDRLSLSTAGDYEEPLFALFDRRRRKYAR